MARHNLGTVVRFEFIRTIAKRRFWVATLFVPVLLIIVFVLVFVSNSSTQTSAEAQKNAHFSFQYTDESGLVSPAIVDSLGGTVTIQNVGRAYATGLRATVRLPSTASHARGVMQA